MLVEGVPLSDRYWLESVAIAGGMRDSVISG
jgi:hypothetical protein